MAVFCGYTNNNDTVHLANMSNSRKKKGNMKRDQALNDATHGQFGEEPRAQPAPDERELDNDNRSERVKSARKLSKS